MLAAPPTSVRFSLLANVAPPVVDGQVLQATHVYLHGKFAYVSYMTAGEASLGAVDVFDIRKPGSPELVSEAILSGTDVAAIAVDGGDAYLATGSDDTTFAERAVFEQVSLRHSLLTTGSTRVGLPSYFGTGVDTDGKTIFVTSGTGGPNLGGLTMLDARTMAPVGTDAFADARSVTVGKKVVAVVQGSPARLRLYDLKTRAFLGSVDLPGGTIPDSKSAWS